MSGSFALFATLLAADHLRRGAMGADVEPAREGGVTPQRRRLARQGNENHLRDVLREMGITADAAQSGGMNHGKVPLNKFRKRPLGVILDKTTE